MPLRSTEPVAFTVTADLAGLTLAAVLRRQLAGESWSAVRRIIAARRVLVNQALCLDVGRKLTANEGVQIVAVSQARPPGDDDVRVRYVDCDLIVVEKPAGMTTLRHAAERAWPLARRVLQPTLDEAVGRLLTKSQPPPPHSRGTRLPRLRAVQRLDRDTSGLLVLARSVDAERMLIEQFSAHTVDRVYWAVVLGYPCAQRIEKSLVRDRGDGLRGVANSPAEGQAAITHVRPLEQLGRHALIECRLETGRTHQIRLHLADLGHPVCGDYKYWQPLAGHRPADDSRAPRLALHAAALGFIHPTTGVRMPFEMPLPSDLAKFCDRLRASAR